jgi:hypothetical protein
MSTIQLQEPLIAGGLQATNFFNGRLLSGEDLTHEQAMNLLGHRRIGQAIGAGVAFGLEVKKNLSQSTTNNPVLTVKSGLAVNAAGQILWLQDDTDIAVAQISSTTPSTGDVFGACDAVIPGVAVASDGAYLLVLAPAKAKEGKAPVSGLGNVPAVCNSRYTTFGIQFRLLQLPVSIEFADGNRARNRVAYRCFGTTADVAFYRNPFNLPAWRLGLPDDVRPIGLTDCDVPLAVIGWRTAGIQFVDQWAVRRRITRPAADRDWRQLLSDQRLSEGEAMFLQFGDEVDDILASGLPLSQVTARGSFAYLPPVGLLPLSTGASAKGFDYNAFFSNMTYRKPVFIEGAQLRPLLREALDYPPIDTTTTLVVWLYLVRENAQATLTLSQPPPAYLVFASGHTPYRGEARYDVNHWNFSNFS